MKKIFIKTYIVFMTASVLLLACKKDKIVPPATIPNITIPTNPIPPTPSLANVSGVFVAIKLRATTFITVPVLNTTESLNAYLETAVSNLYSIAGGTNAVDGGKITCNDTALTKNVNNTYQLLKYNVNPTAGFSNFFQTSTAEAAKWTVGGNATNNVDTITAQQELVLVGFPTMPNLNFATPPTIKIADGFTFDYGTITNCDSLVFQIVGGEASVITTKSKPNNGTSFTLTATDLAILKPTLKTPVTNLPSGQISVFAYKYGVNTLNQRNYGLVNVSARAILVNIE